MNEKKTYKALIVIVAVAALGFGGRWLFGRDSGGDVRTALQTRTGPRKPRGTVRVTPPKDVRKPRSGPKADIRQPKRNVRKPRDTTPITRRKPRNRQGRKVTRVTYPDAG